MWLQDFFYLFIKSVIDNNQLYKDIFFYIFTNSLEILKHICNKCKVYIHYFQKNEKIAQNILKYIIIIYVFSIVWRVCSIPIYW